MLLIVCLPVVFWEETETALGLAAILLEGICRETMLTSLPQFSFPLDWRCDGHDFFFRGDKLVTGASAREVYDRANSLIPRRCVGAGAALGPSWNLLLLVALAFFLGASLLSTYTTLFLTDQLGSFLVEDTTLLESMQPSISMVTSSLVGSTVVAFVGYPASSDVVGIFAVNQNGVHLQEIHFCG